MNLLGGHCDTPAEERLVGLSRTMQNAMELAQDTSECGQVKKVR